MNSSKNCSGACSAGAGNGITLLKRSALFISSALLLFACGVAEKDRMAYAEEQKAVADSVAAYMPGLNTDTINGITHNFIRTASMKCRVNNVLSSTRKIEEIARELGGYVTQSNLNSDAGWSHSAQVSKDSVMELVHYTTSSNLTLRVPAEEMDSLLNRVSAIALFVDFRHIQASDVKTKIFANRLAKRRYAEYKKRVQTKSDRNSDKLNQNVSAEENALEKQTLADNKRIETVELADQVNYCTVSCSLYQPSMTYTSMQAMTPQMEVYEPPFYAKLGTAFMNGFELLKGFLLGLVNLWSVILILVLLFVLIRRLILHYSRKPIVVTENSGTTSPQ